MLFRQIQTYNDKCRFFIGVNTVWVVQNNKPVIDAMNGLKKRRKAISVSTFDFSTFSSFSTKLPHNNVLMMLNSCFDREESKYITVNIYGVHWVENIKDNKRSKIICLNKQQIKDAVAYLPFNSYLTVGPKISCQIISILMGSVPAPFFVNLSYIFMKINEWTN